MLCAAMLMHDEWWVLKMAITQIACWILYSIFYIDWDSYLD